MCLGGRRLTFLGKETAQSCVIRGAWGLGTGLVFQVGIAHCTGGSLSAVISLFHGTAVA